jgi:uncharacterized membrane protein YwaF
MMTAKESGGKRFNGVIMFSILIDCLRICKMSLYFLIWKHNLTTTLPYHCSSQPVIYIVSPSDFHTGHSCLVRQLVWIISIAPSISALPANRFRYSYEKCSVNDGAFVNMMSSLVRPCLASFVAVPRIESTSTMMCVTMSLMSGVGDTSVIVPYRFREDGRNLYVLEYVDKSSLT